MWRDRMSIIAFLVLLIGGTLLIVEILFSPLFDQNRLPLFIAALSSLFSAVGVVASWLSILETQKDRDALFKPEIYVDIEPQDFAINFVIRNDGRSPAHNIKIEIDPVPVRENGKPITDDVDWLEKPIRTLLPGRKLAKFLGGHLMLNADIPKTFTVKVEYESSSGKKYSDGPYILDIEQYRGSMVTPPDLAYSLNKLVSVVEKIEKHKSDCT